MSLTFKISNVPIGMLPEIQLRPAPALRAPVDVRFRQGADLMRISAAVLAEPYVRLMAAVGAGKSSRMPHALALASRGLVVYTTANRLLALSAYNYACKRAVDDASIPPLHRYCDEMVDKMPDSGVLYCGAGEYVSLMLHAKKQGRRLSDHLVFLDEAHKCDVWTFVVRKLALSVGATHLVEASATFEPDSNIRRETEGSVREKTYSSEPVVKWDVLEQGKPWSVSGISNNVVVYTDSRTEAATIMAAYRSSGFFVHRLAADMQEQEFNAAMRDLNDKRGPLVALVADSSFRDGFTFDASLCIDVGKVGFSKYTSNGVVRAYRELYKLERIQTAGRFSRVGKAESTYYYPDVAYPSAICALAPVEMEATAYVYRLLGFQPVGELATAIMATAELPAEYEFSTIINAPYPMQHYVMDSRGRPRTPPPAYAGDKQSGSVGDSKRDSAYAEASLKVPVAESVSSGASRDSSRSSVGDKRPAEREVHAAASFTDLFSQVRMSQPGLLVLSEGDYCTVPTLTRRDVSLVNFPRGLASVDKYMPPKLTALQLAAAIGRYSDDFLDDALDLVLGRYNVLNAYVRATTSALQRVYNEGVGNGAAQLFWRELEHIAEEHTDMKAERVMMMGRLKVLVDGRHTARVMETVVQAETDYSDGVYDKLKRAAGYIGRNDGDTLDRVHVDMERADARGSRAIASKSSQSMILSSSGDWVCEKYGMPAWSGCKNVEDWYDRDGRWAETRYNTNIGGRLLTGGVRQVVVERQEEIRTVRSSSVEVEKRVRRSATSVRDSNSRR